MKITDALLGEHALLYVLFSHAGELIQGKPNLAELRVLISILEKQLASHAEMEEQFLFPALEPHLGQAGPLAMMNVEHNEIERYLGAIKSEESPEKLKTLISELLDLAHGHFQKEEMVLFGMARQFLSGETLEALGEEWAAARDVVINGAGCPSQNAAAE